MFLLSQKNRFYFSSNKVEVVFTKIPLPPQLSSSLSLSKKPIFIFFGLIFLTIYRKRTYIKNKIETLECIDLTNSS